MQEIRQGNVKEIFFVDDKIVGNRACARMLFEAFIPLELRRGGQTPPNLARMRDYSITL